MANFSNNYSLDLYFPKSLGPLSFFFLSQLDFYHNLSFGTIWVLSHPEFFSSQFEFEFCHTLSFWVLSKFELLGFVIFWVMPQLDFCHNLSFVTIWVVSQLEFCHNLSLFFVTIWFFEFCQHLSFWGSSQFEVFFNFVTIWVFF